jgi:hypothetical protein
MFHSGKELPVYLEDCLRQFCKFNPYEDIYFITDVEHFGNPIFSRYEVETVNKDDYYSNDIRHFELLYGKGEKDFWTITVTRLFYIANFLDKEGWINVYHFENDVLIYTDLSKHESTFKHLYKDLAITVGGPDKCMTGFMFIKSSEALKHMIEFFMNLLKTSRVQDIRKQYGMDMVNEMTLIRAYSKDNPDKIKFLPILPFGEFSQDYDKFNSIFDPASWGQYVGGTLDGVPGAMPDDHYIGLLLREHPEYDVIWKDEENGKVPYFKFDKQEVKINNLHIHSKNLHLYIS